MLSFYYIPLLFLCNFSFLSPVLSIHCNETQYPWPVGQPTLCCNNCAPGTYMVRRTEKKCFTECARCMDGHYMDTYSVRMRCEICHNCNKSNMEYETPCSSTRNSVCRCKAGFRCSGQFCEECIPVPTTEITASTSRVTSPPSVKDQEKRDSMWYLVIIALLFVGMALIISKLKPFLRWIRSKHGYLLAEKTTPRPEETTEDEGVSKPVQEMCGKCDQPIDV